VLRIIAFLVLYLFTSATIIPTLAKLNGRVPLPITKSDNLIPHNYITPLLNRHYVKSKLKTQLTEIANKTHADNPNLKVSYLDANFPFIDGFPLLPHLSHKDGRKVDLCLFYTKDNLEGMYKPSNSGYGKYIEPSASEFNQTEACKSKGYWQYDYTKYLSLGGRDDLEFDNANTRQLVQRIVTDPLTQKLLIEPHLKHRMKLTHQKIRFHGCHAVRHDDHIHYQID